MAGRGRDAPIGGQAVLEGVMMRGVRTWSVAVREPTSEQLEHPQREIPTGSIGVQSFPLRSALRRHRLLRLPILRGVVALGGSLAIGLRALNISANAQLVAPPREGETEGEGDALSGAARTTNRSPAWPGRARSRCRSRSRSACSSWRRWGWSA